MASSATLDLADSDAVERRKSALRSLQFEFGGRALAYHVDGGNKPFDNERAVELAVAEDVLRGHDPATVLEVGNVLSHYFDTSHAVLDKFEEHPAVTWNADVLSFVPPFAPALIISVSTLEHVGHVERPSDPTGFSRAIAALLTWLRPGGELVITVPLGYNPSVLALLEQPDQPFDDIRVMKRVSEDNEWIAATLGGVRDAAYGRPFPCGNAIVIARARKPELLAPAGDPPVPTVMDASTSADLLRMYDRRYYRRMAGGAVHERHGDLRELTNIWRAESLALAPQLRTATDIGSGRGELARHLIAGGTHVTLVDYAEPAIEIAREYVGETDLASFVVGDAARLLDYVAPGSQDAVFMTDVVEHISTSELGAIFAQVRQVLSPGGLLVVHTPEKYFGSVTTNAAVQGVHINLFEIDTLRDLLAETFKYADAFTWNGVERFASRGKCVELFGLGRESAYECDHHPERETMRTTEHRLFAATAGAWSKLTLVDDPGLPPRFILRFDVDILESTSDARFHVLLCDASGAVVAWTGCALASLREAPADLFLASETFNRLIPGVGWNDVASVVVRTLFTVGESVDLRLTDIRVMHA